MELFQSGFTLYASSFAWGFALGFWAIQEGCRACLWRRRPAVLAGHRPLFRRRSARPRSTGQPLLRDCSVRMRHSVEIASSQGPGGPDGGDVAGRRVTPSDYDPLLRELQGLDHATLLELEAQIAATVQGMGGGDPGESSSPTRRPPTTAEDSASESDRLLREVRRQLTAVRADAAERHAMALQRLREADAGLQNERARVDALRTELQLGVNKRAMVSGRERARRGGWACGAFALCMIAIAATAVVYLELRLHMHLEIGSSATWPG